MAGKFAHVRIKRSEMLPEGELAKAMGYDGPDDILVITVAEDVEDEASPQAPPPRIALPVNASSSDVDTRGSTLTQAQVVAEEMGFTLEACTDGFELRGPFIGEDAVLSYTSLAEVLSVLKSFARDVAAAVARSPA